MWPGREVVLGSSRCPGLASWGLDVGVVMVTATPRGGGVLEG